jgi:hypothetical protein
MTYPRPRFASLASAIGAGLLALAATPGMADDENNGAQENTGSEDQTGFDAIELPSAESTGVFITQIGTANRATVNQGSNSSHAKVAQSGERNQVVLTQDANGRHNAAIAQDGEGNGLVGQQAGNGQTVLLLAQQGNGNLATVSQTDDGSSYSAAAIQQRGNGNELLLVQDGSDNQARLTQDGTDNKMTASQLGGGNRLQWNQIGDGLADLQIAQDGGSTIQVTQSNAGAAFAPPPSSPGG